MKAVAGYGGFIDEEMIDHGVVGGTIRVPLTERLGLDGEVLYLRGPDGDHDWLVMPSVTFDLRRGGKVVPYLAGGVGWLRTTQEVGTGPYTSDSWTGSGGVGVRIDSGKVIRRVRGTAWIRTPDACHRGLWLAAAHASR